MNIREALSFIIDNRLLTIFDLDGTITDSRFRRWVVAIAALERLNRMTGGMFDSLCLEISSPERFFEVYRASKNLGEVLSTRNYASGIDISSHEGRALAEILVRFFREILAEYRTEHLKEDRLPSGNKAALQALLPRLSASIVSHRSQTQSKLAGLLRFMGILNDGASITGFFDLAAVNPVGSDQPDPVKAKLAFIGEHYRNLLDAFAEIVRVGGDPSLKPLYFGDSDEDMKVALKLGFTILMVTDLGNRDRAFLERTEAELRASGSTGEVVYFTSLADPELLTFVNGRADRFAAAYAKAVASVSQAA